MQWPIGVGLRGRNIPMLRTSGRLAGAKFVRGKIRLCYFYIPGENGRKCAVSVVY